MPNTFDRLECAPVIDKEVGCFDLVFAGNFGVASNMELILDAAELLLAEAQYRFILIGDGALAPLIRSEISRRRLTNVQMRAPMTRR